MDIRSDAFDGGGSIPVRHTCDGADTSPPLTLIDPPPEAVSLALIVDDPDAPRGTFVHWLVWNLPAGLGALPAGASAGLDGVAPGAGQGTNDFGSVGWGGPCPPPGHGEHTYRFLLHAVDRKLELDEGASREELEAAMEGHVVAEARLEGRYGRS